jgi:4-amino-4-deoxy-L-arabinose transferase-like glycosyltransferase
MRKSDWLAVLIVLSFLVSGIATLSNYGISWDEGLGNLFFGERYLQYLTHFQQKYLDFKLELAFQKALPFNLYHSPLHESPQEFPALADTLSAASMYFVSYGLGLANPVDAFHLFTVLLAALFLWVLYRFAAPRLGSPAALVGILFLALFPRFWGDMHFNPKDIPSTIFIGFTLMATITWHERPTWYKALGVGALFGCAVGIKANAGFVPVILGLSLLPWSIRKKDWLETLRATWAVLWQYGLMAVSGLLVYFASWPYLYDDPRRVMEYFNYITTQGGRKGGASMSILPLLKVLTTTPEIMLVFLGIGLFFVLRRARQEKKSLIWRLLAVWLIFPILRVSLPHMADFDGIRHFLEFVPAAALVAGYGLVRTVQLFKAHLNPQRVVIAVIALLAIVNYASITAAFYPYEYIYYNRLAGELPGGRRIFGPNEATDYWAVSYRQGLQWLHQNAVQNANLYVPVADWLVKLPSAYWLRPDLSLFGPYETATVTSGQGPAYLMTVARPEYYDALTQQVMAEQEPAYTLQVDGAEILYIYRMR